MRWLPFLIQILFVLIPFSKTNGQVKSIECPLKNGMIYINYFDELIKHSPGRVIYSKDSIVFFSGSGIVYKIFKKPENLSIAIKSNSFIYIIANMSSTDLAEGDSIKPKTMLGNCKDEMLWLSIYQGYHEVNVLKNVGCLVILSR